MNKYKISLEGSNVLMDIEESIDLYGFLLQGLLKPARKRRLRL
jgi:hypothetical protein